MTSTPEWITSQRIARGECITCGKSASRIQCDECWNEKHGEK